MKSKLAPPKTSAPKGTASRTGGLGLPAAIDYRQVALSWLKGERDQILARFPDKTIRMTTVMRAAAALPADQGAALVSFARENGCYVPPPGGYKSPVAGETRRAKVQKSSSSKPCAYIYVPLETLDTKVGEDVAVYHDRDFIVIHRKDAPNPVGLLKKQVEALETSITKASEVLQTSKEPEVPADWPAQLSARKRAVLSRWAELGFCSYSSFTKQTGINRGTLWFARRDLMTAIGGDDQAARDFLRRLATTKVYG